MNSRTVNFAKNACDLFFVGLYGVAAAFVGALVFIPATYFFGLEFLPILSGLRGFALMALPGGFCWAIAMAFLHRSHVWWLASIAGALPVVWKFFDEDILRTSIGHDAFADSALTACAGMAILSLTFFSTLSWLLINRERMFLADFRHWDAVSAFADAAPFNSWRMSRRLFGSFVTPIALLTLLIGAKLQPVLAVNQRHVARYGFGQVLAGSWRHIVPTKRYESCLTNLKSVGLAMAQYDQDYDDHCPLVTSGGKYYGWADGLQPYLRNLSTFQCPREAWVVPRGNPRLPDYTDYWFNGNLPGVSLMHLANSAQTWSFGDGNDGTEQTDARYSLKSLPSSWMTITNSPALRHLNGYNFCFADGHAKYVPIAHIKGSGSFSLK